MKTDHKALINGKEENIFAPNVTILVKVKQGKDEVDVPVEGHIKIDENGLFTFFEKSKVSKLYRFKGLKEEDGAEDWEEI